ncbi:MAG: FAD-dependent oxidoreductase, partial [Candidatus Rokuibacteriota bacterium]
MSVSAARPHVVVVGGGFAGLAAARVLAREPVRVTLVDRRNHHLFQPLLYQVATAALSPAEIAMPLRSIFRKARNVKVLLAEVEKIDLAARRVRGPLGVAEVRVPHARAHAQVVVADRRAVGEHDPLGVGLDAGRLPQQHARV